KPLIDAHARYLQGDRNGRMTIQGNTDERGSREYNIALGQRLADAVKKMMVLLGATDSQIETVSFGKEKPKNPGHDEGAWTENRRGQYEGLTYGIERAQKRQRDLYLDLDSRLRRIETAPAAAGPAVPPEAPPAAAGLPSTTAGSTPGRSVDVAGEQRAYDAAL